VLCNFSEDTVKTLFHDLKEDKMHKDISFLSFCNFFSLMNYLLYKKQERKKQSMYYILHKQLYILLLLDQNTKVLPALFCCNQIVFSPCFPLQLQNLKN